MKLDPVAATTSTVIRYKVSGAEPVVKRDAHQYVEFVPDAVRVLISDNEMQIHVEGKRLLRRGRLSPMRHSERFYTRDLEPDVEGTPLWIRDLAKQWRDSIRNGTLQKDVRYEMVLTGGND